MTESDFEILHLDLMKSLDRMVFGRYSPMRHVHPAERPYVWRQCLSVALDELNGYTLSSSRDFPVNEFHEAIGICSMFIMGRESYLKAKGETMLNKIEMQRC